MMDDRSLAAYLDLSEKEAADFIPHISSERREVYERMAEIEIDLEMGVVPNDVIVCRKCRTH